MEVMRSCSWPISVASVGWYPTALGMRPRSADTSEPACVNRKMLSMNRSTFFPWSRKNSAIVSAESPTRRRAPGGSFICPYTSATRSSTPDSSISSSRSLPSRVRSPTPREDGYAAVLASNVVDQLLDQHRLAEAGAAEEADLAAGDERRQQVDHLEAGLEHFDPRRELGELRRIAVNRPALRVLRDIRLLVDGLADHVPDAAERQVADRYRDRAAGVFHFETAREAVGRVHRNGADPVVAQVLLHLGDDGARLLPVLRRDVDAECGVDLREAFREDDVDHDALDLDDPAGLLGALFGHGSPGDVFEEDEAEAEGLPAGKVYRDSRGARAPGARGMRAWNGARSPAAASSALPRDCEVRLALR